MTGLGCGWTIMTEITTTPISISVPIMCHRESYSQWIGPRANTEPALSALYHRGQLSPGQGRSLVTRSRGQDAGARGPPGHLGPDHLLEGFVARTPSPQLQRPALTSQSVAAIIHARHYWHPWFWAGETILWKVTESKWPLCCQRYCNGLTIVKYDSCD